MQVKTDFTGQPPKLTFGYNMTFAVLSALALTVALCMEWVYQVGFGIILATAAGGGFLFWMALYICDGYWLDHTGLYYAPLTGKATKIFSWEDVQDVYLTMHLTEWPDIKNKYSSELDLHYTQCVIITTKKTARLLTYEEGTDAINEDWCRAFALNSPRFPTKATPSIDKHALFAFAKQIGLKIADRTHEHPCYHDPELKKLLW